MRGILVVGLTLALTLGCAAKSAPPAPAESPAARFADDAEAIERGRLLFVGSCGGYCHSTHDEERPAPSLFDCTWKHGGSDAEIFRTISAGVADGKMPGWAKAMPEGDADIWRIIAYLRKSSTCGRGAAKSAH